MGNSTGSMFYAAVTLIAIYLVGVSIYQIFLWVKKAQEKKKSTRFDKE